MIKLFTYTDWLNSTNRRAVFPLLFDLHYQTDSVLNQYYSLTNSLEEADFAVFPIDYVANCRQGGLEKFRQFYSQAQQQDIPIWVYSGGDFGKTMEEEGIWNFRFGGFDQIMTARDLIMPSFIDDPYQSVLDRSFTAVDPGVIPEIGFVGYAQHGIGQYLGNWINHLKDHAPGPVKICRDAQAFYSAPTKRYQYLKRLEAHPSIDSNFIFRNKYRAGALTDADRQRSIQEFYENIFETVYTFCLRGRGNFSVRFYEALAMGRIPVLIDTDCRLPLSTIVDWNQHALIVTEKDAPKLGDRLLAFHSGFSKEKLVELQQNNRLLWEHKLTRTGYFKEIYHMFKPKARQS